MSALSDQRQHLKVNVWLGSRLPRFAIWAALVIACAVSLALRQVDTRYEFDLLPKDVAHEEGVAFQAPIAGQVWWPWHRAADGMSDPRRSRLLIFEDGRPLGPPHQSHVAIRSLGDGRYSHWNNFILFSASDNSDPRTNGRHYYAKDYSTLSPLVEVVPWLLLLGWATASASVWTYAKKVRLILSEQLRHLKSSVWPVGRVLHFVIWAALAIACAGSLALQQVDTQYEFHLLPKDIAHEEGVAFEARIAGQVWWPWHRAADGMLNPRRSRLVIFEDGRPLGPPHQSHVAIRSLGDGRYSHWNDFILFSASDNGDPRINGRHYRAVDLAALSPVVTVLPWLLLLGWGTASARVWTYAKKVRLILSDQLPYRKLNVRRVGVLPRLLLFGWATASAGAWTYSRSVRLIRRLSSTYWALERRIGALGIFLILVIPVVVFANAFFIRHWPSPATISPDTAGYFGFSEVRTVGYPAFLKMVMILFGNLRLLVPIQLNLLLGSIVILGWAVARVVGSLLCGIALVLVLALNPSLLTWTYHILTEGLFIPLLLAHAAFVLLLLKQSSRAIAALAGMTLVAAILVRPAAYSLLLNLPLLILLLRRRQISILAWTIIPAAALYMAAAGLHRVDLGTWRSQSFGGYTLLGKVALLIHGNVPGAPPLGEEIYRRIAPQVREMETKGFPIELSEYTVKWYDKILYTKITPVLDNYVKVAYSFDTGDAIWRRINSVAGSLAIHVIEQDPIEYLKLVLATYYDLWSITFTEGVAIDDGYVESMDQSLALLRQDSNVRSLADQVGLDENIFRIARAAYLEDLARYRPLDKYLQTAIPTFQFALLSIAAGLVFSLGPYWLWRLLTGRVVRGPSAALLYLGFTVSSYYLLVASVEFASPRYVQAVEGITLTIDTIVLFILIAHLRVMVPAILLTFRDLFFRKGGSRAADWKRGSWTKAIVPRSAGTGGLASITPCRRPQLFFWRKP